MKFGSRQSINWDKIVACRPVCVNVHCIVNGHFTLVRILLSVNLSEYSTYVKLYI